jgi:hypothetical protein
VCCREHCAHRAHYPAADSRLRGSIMAFIRVKMNVDGKCRKGTGKVRGRKGCWRKSSGSMGKSRMSRRGKRK